MTYDMVNIASQIERNIEAVISRQAQHLVNFRTRNIGSNTNVLDTVNVHGDHGGLGRSFDVQGPTDNTRSGDLFQLEMDVRHSQYYVITLT